MCALIRARFAQDMFEVITTRLKCRPMAPGIPSEQPLITPIAAVTRLPQVTTCIRTRRIAIVAALRQHCHIIGDMISFKI